MQAYRGRGGSSSLSSSGGDGSGGGSGGGPCRRRGRHSREAALLVERSLDRREERRRGLGGRRRRSVFLVIFDLRGAAAEGPLFPGVVDVTVVAPGAVAGNLVFSSCRCISRTLLGKGDALFAMRGRGGRG